MKREEAFKSRMVKLLNCPKLIEQKLFKLMKEVYPQLNQNSIIKVVNQNPVVYSMTNSSIPTEVATYQVPKPGLLNKFLRITDDLDNIPFEKNSGYETHTQAVEYRNLSVDKVIKLEIKSFFIHRYAIEMVCGYYAEEDTLLLLQDEYYYTENPMGNLI